MGKVTTEMWDNGYGMGQAWHKICINVSISEVQKWDNKDDG